MAAKLTKQQKEELNKQRALIAVYLGLKYHPRNPKKPTPFSDIAEYCDEDGCYNLGEELQYDGDWELLMDIKEHIERFEKGIEIHIHGKTVQIWNWANEIYLFTVTEKDCRTFLFVCIVKFIESLNAVKQIINRWQQRAQ